MKFFLNISKEDQLARFAEWLEDPKRNWKISESDYTERALWDDYIAAFEDAISATSTREALWYIIPANHKWFRNLAVSQIMADTMEALEMAFPKPSVDLAEIQRKYHAAVAAGRERKRWQPSPRDRRTEPVLGPGVAALGTIRREVHWDDDVADRPCGGREALEHSDP